MVNIFLKAKRKIVNIIGKKISFFRKSEVYDKKRQNFSIISCNCIGGLLYHKYSMKFLSPTINLFFEARDFIKFVNNIKYYLSLELQFDDSSKEYPIGVLGDIRIHFLHYKSFADAKNAWYRRLKRINFENMFFIFSDRDGFDKDCLDAFLLFKGKKVLFSHCKYDDPNVCFVRKDLKKREVDDLTCYYGLTGKRVFEYYFDFEKWLYEGECTDKCRLNQ